jgi:hypothetical protein
MFEPSVKSVPGCLVLIVPSLIGVPVAFTPGLGPHDEVLTVVALELLLVDPPLEAALLLELLLLPQPASAINPIIAANAAPSRRPGTCLCILSVSSLEFSL